jgi:TM2 domain-containing membrane protein YozV
MELNRGTATTQRKHMSYGQLPPGPVNPYLIEAMVASSKKSMFTAYALWYFAGGLGAHNFYLGKPMLGGLQIASLPFMLCMVVIGEWIGAETIGGQVVSIVGIAAFGIMLVSLLIDPFLIPSRVRAHSDRVRAQLEAEADWQAA